MRMSVKQLRAFLAVAHTLNFAHASERLNLSQPALSLTIKGVGGGAGRRAAAAQHPQSDPYPGGGTLSADGPSAAGRLG